MSLQDKLKNAEETMWPLTMGVTTEKAMEQLLDIMDSMPDDACGDWRSSLAYAIETMRKYQKIEQIVNAEFEEYHPLDRNIYRLALIRKVLEDGNDD